MRFWAVNGRYPDGRQLTDSGFELLSAIGGCRKGSRSRFGIAFGDVAEAVFFSTASGLAKQLLRFTNKSLYTE